MKKYFKGTTCQYCVHFIIVFLKMLYNVSRGQLFSFLQQVGNGEEKKTNIKHKI
jgi:hypothetical protein